MAQLNAKSGLLLSVKPAAGVSTVKSGPRSFVWLDGDGWDSWDDGDAFDSFADADGWDGDGWDGWDGDL